MSKPIAAAAIRGAQGIVLRTARALDAAALRHGSDAKLGFPGTEYHLPLAYALLGIPVRTLRDAKAVLDRARERLPGPVLADSPLPRLESALDAGIAALLAEELAEALRCLEEPGFYAPDEHPTDARPWVGPASDAILQRRGSEFVAGTASGFALVLGSAPDPQVAARIAQELRERNIYAFLAGGTGSAGFAQQLRRAGVKFGWSTHLVPLGPDPSAAVFALGLAARAAMVFGSAPPGDLARNLAWIKTRFCGFTLLLGEPTDESLATALGAMSFGCPIITDTAIAEDPPGDAGTGDHVVANVPLDRLVARAIEVRGMKIALGRVPIPVAYGPIHEGERIRDEELHLEAGGSRTVAVELTVGRPMSDVEDGRVEVLGPDLDTLPVGSRVPLAIVVEVAGRAMQEDFEPILERQNHHMISCAQGVMHVGRRDLILLRIGRAAVEQGFRLADLGRILHAGYHSDFGTIVDKVRVRICTGEAEVRDVLVRARAAYAKRDARVEGMTDEDVSTFYSCTMCQSVAPAHVCVVTPERAGLCGSNSWLDCRAAAAINPHGPNQPIEKGRTIDADLGRWEGVDRFVAEASRGAVPRMALYSILHDPMTSCGGFECIAAILPRTNGVMVVDRDFCGMTPAGLDFAGLAGLIAGGVVTPGFLGHSRKYLVSPKFLRKEGGLRRVTWMTRRLKDELRGGLARRAEALGMPDLPDRVADETVGTTEDEVRNFLETRKHPALELEPLL